MIAFFDDVNGNFSLLMQRLMDYKRKHGINCLVIFLIDKNKMYCIEKVDKREDCCYMFSILNGNNVVSLACQNSRPVHHRIEENDTIVTMKENVVEELCIPIKIYTDENITVCIYCGFNQNNSNMRDVLTSFLLGFNIYEIYSYALAKYNQISKVERILKLLMIIEDNIKLNQPSMKLHSINVAFWTIEIAKKLNFRTDDFVKLYYAALFHDIGKVRIKNSIINKEGPLTEEEYEEVKHHVEYSYIIVKELIGDIYPDISLWIRCHHEKYDGTGYPYGLKGNDIPFASRIIKVADVIDVLHSPRSYKTPVSIDRIIAELKKKQRERFRPGCC